MWQALIKAFTALKAGERLANVEGWKNTQATANDVCLVLGAILAILRLKWPELVPSDAILLSAGSGVALVLSAINSYLTRATTYKIGL